jgi:hypothetical protein
VRLAYIFTVRAVVDTSALASFLAAADTVTPGRVEPLAAWAAYERQQPAVFASYLQGWGSPQRRPAAAAVMAATAARLRAAAVDWPGLLEYVAVGMAPLVGADLEVPVVVFVGMGTSNGWVTDLGGRRTVFLAAELIPDPALGAVLAAHELTHVVQHLLNPAWDGAGYPIAAHAYAEGLATHVSAVAVPGRRDDEYLWFDGVHQPWLADCERAWPVAAAALRAVLDEPCGGAAERRFFTLHPAGEDTGMPSRFGYHAGLRVLRDAARTHSVAELLSLGVPAAGELVRDHLDLTGRDPDQAAVVSNG